MRVIMLTILAAMTASPIHVISSQSQSGQRSAAPPAKYQVRVEEDTWITMRDSVRLSTDFYFPEGVDGKLPVVLIRTPYNKRNYRRANLAPPRRFAGQGYIVAVQD